MYHPRLLSLCHTVQIQLSQLTVCEGNIIDLLYMYCTAVQSTRYDHDVLFLQPFWQAASWAFFLPVPLMSLDRDGDYYFGCDCDRFGLVTLYTVAKHLTFILLHLHCTAPDTGGETDTAHNL